MKLLKQQEEDKKRTKILFPLSLIISLIIAVSIAKIFISNMYIQSSLELAKINLEIESLVLENNQKKMEIYRNSSLAEIKEKALILGMGKTADYVYLRPLSIAFSGSLH